MKISRKIITNVYTILDLLRERAKMNLESVLDQSDNGWLFVGYVLSEPSAIFSMNVEAMLKTEELMKIWNQQNIHLIIDVVKEWADQTGGGGSYFLT